MTELVSRSIRLTREGSPRSAVRALIDELWHEAGDVDAADRSAVERAVDTMLDAVFPDGEPDGAAVCSLLMSVRDDRLEVIAAAAAPAPLDEPVISEGAEVLSRLRDLVDLARVRSHGSITEWELVRARAHARSFAVPTATAATTADVPAELRRQRALEDMHVFEHPDDDRFDRVTRLAIELFRVGNSAVNLIDRDRAWSRSLAGGGSRTVPRARSLCNVTITQDSAYVLPDIGADPRASVILESDHRFYAGLPLYSAGGERIGAFCIYDSEPRSFSARDETVLRDLTALVQQELSVSRELARGARVRRRLMPDRAATSAGWSVAGFSVAERGFGAEFVDWSATDAGITLSLGDARDTDAGAAVLAATVRAALRSSAPVDDHGGADEVSRSITAAARALGADPDDHDTAVAVFHGRIDPATGALHYVDAGHGLAVILRVDGSRQVLPSTAPPLGASVSASRPVASRTLEQGDALVVVSDGALDLVGGGEGALERLAAAASSARDPEAFISAMRDRVGSRTHQDVTALVVRRHRAA
ncbi:MAG: SpoIIE family protein phosphatase [Yonghaparkia sp.]|nr:SpoIIE family protein phosphatase [Microcella sp.]